jgi:AcrR family transcriptional regulator
MLVYRPLSVDQRAEQTRSAIVAAATEAFRLYGYAETTMGAVAVLAGVSPRTLYRHYGSKGALLAATIAVGAGDFLEQLRAYVGHWPLRRSILTAFTHAVIDVSEESRALMHLAITEDEVNRHWLSTSQRMLPSLTGILCAAARCDPGCDSVTWEVRSAALLSAITVGYRRWATTPGTDLLAVITEAVDTVLPILGPAPESIDANQATGEDWEDPSQDSR